MGASLVLMSVALTRQGGHFVVTRLVALVLVFSVAACAGPVVRPDVAPQPPAFMIGEFVDDYGARYAISGGAWVQLPQSRYRIVRWNVRGQYIIAQNDSANPSAGGRWTRIDWLPLVGMPPYAWGFCYSAYTAATVAAAESTHVAERSTPRTGCNGFPFSRMRPGVSQHVPPSH